ncbi:MAG: glycine cleavage system aminomethyltransferase GcvT [Granulosicoccaceae bacterium]
MSDDALLKTPLHDLHLELGGKMVGFAGYSMPVQFPLGIMGEHKHTRAKAGLFDVSHMGQVTVRGETPAQDFESLVPVDVIGIAPLTHRYALFTNKQGGIDDDLMISNAGDYLFVVVNAACKERDLAYMQANLPKCDVELIEDRALLAIQGPAAAAVMARLAPDTASMVFMDWRPMQIAGIDCFIGRAGYTGEDGFEISVPADQADAFARQLLAEEEVEAIGLGARDSLRLEAGLCLYGHDLDTTTSPVEASLLWAMQKVRRADGERAGGFPGAEVIMKHLAEGVGRKRVGLKVAGRAPVREGAELQDGQGTTIGAVTSGGFGPTLEAPVAMGYVATEFAKLGTELVAIVRNREIAVTVEKMPMVEQRYFRG